MITLTTDTNQQRIFIIPRSSSFNSVEITDDQTNVTVYLEDWTFIAGDYYNRFEAVFNLVENHFYDFVIKEGDTIVYRDRIFCTNQDLVTFSVNNGQYVSNSTTNEFIVYE